jgi:hypothetical protein
MSNQACQPGGAHSSCGPGGHGNLTVLHTGGKTRIVYTTTLAWYYPVTFALAAGAELTLLGNMQSDDKEAHNRIADVTHADSNASVVEAYDLFRRLGRLDLQVHRAVGGEVIFMYAPRWFCRSFLAASKKLPRHTPGRRCTCPLGIGRSLSSECSNCCQINCCRRSSTAVLLWKLYMGNHS